MSPPEVTRGAQPTRLETFVDAAFAFALTMLVISVDAIPRSYAELNDALLRVPAFAASFAITVMFWHGHYRWSRSYGVEDTASVVLSLVLVFLVLVFLYPLRLMMSGALNAMTGGLLPSELTITEVSHARTFFGVYGLAFALMSSVLLALNARVLRLPFSPPLAAAERVRARVEVEVWAILSAMGTASAVLAILMPPRLLAVAGWMFASLAIIMPVMGRRWKRLSDQAATTDRSDAK
jgi:uncharacterized membrane protein